VRLTGISISRGSSCWPYIERRHTRRPRGVIAIALGRDRGRPRQIDECNALTTRPSFTSRQGMTGTKHGPAPGGEEVSQAGAFARLSGKPLPPGRAPS